MLHTNQNYVNERSYTQMQKKKKLKNKEHR